MESEYKDMQRMPIDTAEQRIAQAHVEQETDRINESKATAKQQPTWDEARTLSE